MDPAEEAAIAAAAISATLAEWTSPKLGTVRNLSTLIFPHGATTADHLVPENVDTDDDYVYDRDPVEWLLEGDEDDEEEEYDTMEDGDHNHNNAELLIRRTQTPSPRQKRTLHRAGTPIMSNASSKHSRLEAEEDDITVPFNVESPWVNHPSPIHTPGLSSSSIPTAAATAAARTPHSTTTAAAVRRAGTHPHPRAPSAAVVQRSQPSAQSAHVEYRRYHDAVERFLRHKRRVLEQVEWQNQFHDAVMVATPVGPDHNDNDNLVPESHPPLTLALPQGTSSTTAADTARLMREELQVELEFLSSLNVTSWGRGGGGRAVKEGNVWKLLGTLRKLGLPALLWDDDETSLAQHRQDLVAHLQRLAHRTDLTPAALLSHCYHQPPQPQPQQRAVPLVLQRRKHILHWLEQCFQNVLPPDATRPRPTKPVVAVIANHYHWNRTNLLRGQQQQQQQQEQQSLFPSTDQDAALFQASLSLLLAGRWSDVLHLLRESGVAWRAALWDGGSPHGYRVRDDGDPPSGPVVRSSTGNPRRALWRRTLWKHSEQLRHDHTAAAATTNNADEAAIAALLASNLQAALDSPSLRTWEKALFATIKCVVDRTEDELLHLHNNHRRLLNPPFPGTEFVTSEKEHLQATSEIANMNETDVVRLLASAPSEEMQGLELITQATASILVGKTAIDSFMQRSLDQSQDLDGEDLRFVTHLALYLDALSFGTTAVALEGVSLWKNELLLQYIRHLASREDLWYMLVLYASFLPEHTILAELPTLLQPIESHEERKVIVKQLGDFLSFRNGLDLKVLRNIISLVLAESDDDEEEAAVSRDVEAPTRLDQRKMKAVLWLCVNEEHAGDALIAANTLLRQFFSAGNSKGATASVFVEEVLDRFLTSVVIHSEMAGGEGVGDEAVGMTKYVHEAQVQHARSEHVAFLSFLEACKAVQTWKKTMAATAAILPASSMKNESMDKSRLNAMELSIATTAERRKLIEAKRRASQTVVTAANQARKALRHILEHPGGWLLTDDEVVAGGGNKEEMIRRDELNQLRCTLLPMTVMNYNDVCAGTATWMNKSLNDVYDKFHGSMTIQDALRQIDEGGSSEVCSDLSPISPRYWTQKALEVSAMTENDTYMIRSAFHTASYQTLIAQLAETVVLDMMYAV